MNHAELTKEKIKKWMMRKKKGGGGEDDEKEKLRNKRGLERNLSEY